VSGLFIGRGVVATDVHVGYVAGRYRSGVWSDQWTDVSRCAERTFTDYAPACVCGWRGRAHAATLGGHLACQRAWAFEHRTDPTTVATSPGPPRA
jgi:hypothetical protein